MLRGADDGFPRRLAAGDVLVDLVRQADVLVESFAPGQLERWGLPWERLHEINPRMVLVSTSLMGQTGPMKSFAGFGNLGAAIAGYQGLVGMKGALPIGPFGPYTDYVGPRFALVALLAALDRRRTTGRGCWLDISQAEAGIQFLAPAIAGASVAVLDLLDRTTALRDRLMQNAKMFRDGMTKAGFTIKPGIHPIVPVMLGDAKLSQDMAAAVLEEGVYVIGFFFPVVPKGEARIRVQLSAEHTEAHIERAIAALTHAGRKLNVL